MSKGRSTPPPRLAASPRLPCRCLMVAFGSNTQSYLYIYIVRSVLLRISSALVPCMLFLFPMAMPMLKIEGARLQSDARIPPMDTNLTPAKDSKRGVHQRGHVACGADGRAICGVFC